MESWPCVTMRDVVANSEMRQLAVTDKRNKLSSAQQRTSGCFLVAGVDECCAMQTPAPEEWERRPFDTTDNIRPTAFTLLSSVHAAAVDDAEEAAPAAHTPTIAAAEPGEAPVCCTGKHTIHLHARTHNNIPQRRRN